MLDAQTAREQATSADPCHCDSLSAGWLTSAPRHGGGPWMPFHRMGTGRRDVAPRVRRAWELP